MNNVHQRLKKHVCLPEQQDKTQKYSIYNDVKQKNNKSSYLRFKTFDVLDKLIKGLKCTLHLNTFSCLPCHQSGNSNYQKNQKVAYRSEPRTAAP